MTNDTELAQTYIHAVGTLYRPPQTRKRSLGAAIFLVAIADYRSTDEQEHKSAERFLYPQTRKWQKHYDWAVGLIDGLNPAWLREELDRLKAKWDGQRAERMARETRIAEKSQLKVDRRNRPNEKRRGKRIHANGPLVPTELRRNCDPALQPPREACGARVGDVAPGL